MSDEPRLPVTWEKVLLPVVAAINPPKGKIDAIESKVAHFVPMACVDEEFGGIDVSTIRPMSEVIKGYTAFQVGDVLFAKITPCMENGKIAVVPLLEHGVGFGSTEFHVLRPTEIVLPKWIAHYLSQASIRRGAQRSMTGSAGQLRVPTLWLNDQELPIPPINEQRRIVAKIEELFSDLEAGVAALERAKANLKRYRAAVLKAAVEGKLTEEWRAKHPAEETASALLERILKERRQKWEADQLAKFAAAGKQPPKNWRDKYVEPSPPDTSGLHKPPEGWCWVALGQLLHRIEGGKSFECLTRPAEPNEWGVVKVSAMTWGTFLEDEQKAIPLGAEFDPADEIMPNDLLLSRSNTTQLVGATVLVGNCRPRLLLSDKSLRLRAIEIVNHHWLHTVLSSSLARSQLSAMATGTSDSMRNVSQDKIRSVVFPLPPLAEHKWIVEEASERLSQIDSAEMRVEHALLRAARLRQSILKQAFEGKLVPQDPQDEPASVLLERLQASRLVHEGNGKVGPPKRTRGRRAQSKQLEGRAD
jgi:type I restriction enzyme S subunit